jgi:hypothetical protein
MFWIGLIIGCIIGSVITQISILCCLVAGRADAHIEDITKEE